MEARLFRDIIAQAPFGYAYHRLLFGTDGQPEDYVFLEVNSAFEQMTGLHAADILGKRVTEVLPGVRDGEFDWVAFYGRVVQTAGRREFTQHSEPLNSAFRITVFSPEPGHFVTLFQDISAEVQQIRELQQQKSQISTLTSELDQVFNGTHDAMFLVRVDDDGQFRCVRVNSAYGRLVGYAPEEIIGFTPVEAMGPTVGAAVEASYRRCVAAGKPITFEESLSFPTGERIWLTTLSPLLEQGRVKYLVGSRLDITELKRAEGERDQLSKRLHSMFAEHSAVMLMIEPVTGRIVDANPAACEFYGYDRAELLNMSIQEINMLPSLEVEQRRRAALASGQRYFLFPHRLKSGEIRLVDVYSCPVTDSGGPLLFSIISDVTEREQYKLTIQQEKELLRTTLLSIGDGVVTTDATGLITNVNKAATDISGWSESEAVGRPFAEVFRLISEETGEPISDPVGKVLCTGKTIGLANHTALITKDESLISLADSAAPITDEHGQILGVVMVFRDVTAEKLHQDRILHLSYYDQLTGLHNRRFFEERFAKTETIEDMPLAVIMGDLNGLKLTNDIFGHETGDRLLQLVAEVMTESCPPDAAVFRWGGDEFVIVLPRANAALAEDVIGRIRERCRGYRDHDLQLSIALGCAVMRAEADDIWDLLKEAEEQMYRQKLLEGKSFRNTILNTLQATLEAKSYETEAHAMRLKHYSLAVGQALGLPERWLDELALLAVLHDIGKVGVRESILQKPGPLTEAEWVEMKRHPEIGYRISQNTPELSVVSEYILAHHERWDGNGYPRGLRGEEIPLLSRILAVVDAYDAMVSERPYRRPLQHEQAVAELQRHAGSQFDPEVVQAFLASSV